MRFIINTVVSALIIAGFTELSRRQSFLAALLVSLPITSILALSFTFIETGDSAKVSGLSLSIFWLVIPSLGFFLLLPVLLRAGVNFWLALAISCIALAATYSVYSFGLKKIGVEL